MLNELYVRRVATRSSPLQLQHTYNNYTNNHLPSIHYGAWSGQLRIVQLNVARDLTCINVLSMNRGCSPLMLAVMNGHKKVVKWLCQHGADPLLLSKSGKSSYQMAVRFDQMNQKDSSNHTKESTAKHTRTGSLVSSGSTGPVYLSPLEWDAKHNWWHHIRTLKEINPYGGVQMLHLIDSICGVDSNLSTTDRIGRQVFRETTYRVGLRCEDYRLVVTMRTNGGYNYIHGGPGDKYRHTDEDPEPAVPEVAACRLDLLLLVVWLPVLSLSKVSCNSIRLSK